MTDKIHRNQFGGSLGGPIVKDKFSSLAITRVHGRALQVHGSTG